MPPKLESQTCIPPPSKQWGYELIMNEVELDMSKIAALRIFAFPFVINHHAQIISNSQRENPPWNALKKNVFLSLIEYFHKVVPQCTEDTPSKRANYWGKILCKQYEDCDKTHICASHSYESHADHYHTKDFNVDCLFDRSLCEAERRDSAIEYLGLVLDWIYEKRQTKIEEIGDALSQAYQKLFPAYSLRDAVRPAKRAATALYSFLLSVSHQRFGLTDTVNLKNYLPLSHPVRFPRSASQSQHENEISEYITAVESFPLNSEERFQAMMDLWNYNKNYYAGWELFSQHLNGVRLSSASGNFSWRIYPSSRAARSILAELSLAEPSQSVEFCLSAAQDGNSGAYFPAQLKRIFASLATASQEDLREIEPMLERLAPYSLDAKIVYYNTSERLNRSPKPSYFINPGKTWTYNEEIGNIISSDGSVRDRELYKAAQNGSIKCLERCFKQDFWKPELALLVYNMVTGLMPKPIPAALKKFEEILSCYCLLCDNNYSRNDEDVKKVKDIHKNNLSLMKVHVDYCKMYLLETITTENRKKINLQCDQCDSLLKTIDKIWSWFELSTVTELDSADDRDETDLLSCMHSSLPE